MVPPSTPLSAVLQNGRFHATFDHAQLIGSGSFGAVYQAMHRLEEWNYAVKLVQLTIRANELMNTRRELQEVFANLKLLATSPYVVRYFTCWCEEPQFLPSDHEAKAVPGREPSAAKGSNHSSLRFLGSASLPLSGSVPVIDVDDTTDSLGFEWERDADVETQTTPYSIASIGRSRSNDGPSGEAYRITLCLQMELMPGQTLRKWMDEQNSNHGSPRDSLIGRLGVAAMIFKELVKACRDLHKVGIVHRDLKPENIFVEIGPPLVLKIGDFGLARLGVDEKEDRKQRSDSKLVGTPLYIAPEGGGRATSKADIYGVALIGLELLCPRFETSMERSETFTAFRQTGVVPEHIEDLAPDFVNLLRCMAATEPSQRPSAEEVLRYLREQHYSTSRNTSIRRDSACPSFIPFRERTRSEVSTHTAEQSDSDTDSDKSDDDPH
jgi:serine/threonine protein kinase